MSRRFCKYCGHILKAPGVHLHPVQRMLFTFFKEQKSSIKLDFLLAYLIKERGRLISKITAKRHVAILRTQLKDTGYRVTRHPYKMYFQQHTKQGARVVANTPAERTSELP